MVVELAGVRCHVLSVDGDLKPLLLARAAAAATSQQPVAPSSATSNTVERDEQRHQQEQQQPQGHEQQQHEGSAKQPPSSGQQQAEEGAGQRDVVLFVHGGGYLAHMHCVDLPVLTAWAKRLGPSALVVVPEYTLLPHGQYPKPTNELLTVYHAISQVGRDRPTGGQQRETPQRSTVCLLLLLLQGELGFRPRKLVVTGESAGGNLAASLVVCLILKRFSKEELAGMGELYDKCLGPAAIDEAATEEPGGLDHRGAAVAGEAESESLLADLLPTGPPAPPASLLADSSSSSSSSSVGPPLQPAVASPPSRLPEGLIVELDSSSSEDAGEELRVPDAMALFYPVLNFSLSPSPSRVVHISDPVLPLGVLTTITRAYIPKHVHDPTKVGRSVGTIQPFIHSPWTVMTDLLLVASEGRTGGMT